VTRGPVAQAQPAAASWADKSVGAWRPTCRHCRIPYHCHHCRYRHCRCRCHQRHCCRWHSHCPCPCRHCCRCHHCWRRMQLDRRAAPPLATEMNFPSTCSAVATGFEKEDLAAQQHGAACRSRGRNRESPFPLSIAARGAPPRSVSALDLSDGLVVVSVVSIDATAGGREGIDGQGAVGTPSPTSPRRTGSSRSCDSNRLRCGCSRRGKMLTRHCCCCVVQW